jgi:hypothetical protein
VRQGAPAWREDQVLVLDGLLRDLPLLRESGAPAPFAILCTGDVGSTGALLHDDEYDRALDWFAQLRVASGADALFCVPGNHDVQRTPGRSRAALRLIDGVRDGRDELDDAYNDPTDREILVERFEHYRQFAARAGAPTARDPVSAWRVEEQHGGQLIRLVGLNTAVLCNDDTDERKLRTGLQQFGQAFGGAGEEALTIVLAHHPLDWLEAADRNRFEAHLFNQAEVFLHGHLHAPSSELRVKGHGREFVTITAGAVHGDRTGDRRHGYSIAGLFRTTHGQLVVRVWPRRWVERERRFVLDAENVAEPRIYAEYPLPQRMGTVVAAPRRAAGLRGLSDRLIERVGARRTAFPTDLSIAELRERGLTIAARLSTGSGVEESPGGLVAQLFAGRSVLALGRPGSGKTVLVHETALRLRDRGRVPLIVDLATLPTTPANMDELIGALDEEHTPASDEQIVLLVDGVDEQIAGGTPAAEVADYLRALASLAPTLVSCRDKDYEQRLAAMVATNLFATVASIQPWRPAVEFADFVERLAAAGLLTGASVVERVEASAALSGLVERPLLARMLTFVAQDAPDRVLPAESTSLYQAYLGKLGVTATAGVQRLGCESVTEATRLWREAAWHVHRNRLPVDAVPVDALLGQFRDSGVEAECTYRALSSILDMRADPSTTAAGFVHYSFYEFLVAQHVAEGLARAHDADDPAVAARLLDVDLPQEIRRHLTSLLRRTTLDVYAWPGWLARVYRAAKGTTEQQRTIRNLVAYLSCRLNVPATSELRSLLEDERDPFLRNSLMWGLVRLDDRLALEQYLEELQGDELASLNRGYLLYYFGDLERGDPPYEDNPPFVAWDHTRKRLLVRYGDDEAYAATVPTRRVIDLYTLCDFAVVRGQRLTPEEGVVIDRRRRELDDAKLSPEATESLDENLRRVGVGAAA